MHQDPPNKELKTPDDFLEYGDHVDRYKIVEVIGEGGYGVVFSAIDPLTDEKVAIKKIINVFKHVPRAIRTLREIKLLKLLRHPNIVEMKDILIPPSNGDFAEVFVVLELMGSDLDKIIKANGDLARKKHRFIMYQILRALKFMHAANVYHLDLKPTNILINENFKLKVCDFGASRVFFGEPESTTEWRQIGNGTKRYKAPEICGSRYSKHTYAIDIWSIGCIFAEMLMGMQLFPGENWEQQLDLITGLLGTPSADIISGLHNDDVKKYLTTMRPRNPVPFAEVFPDTDPLALQLLQKLLAFDPNQRPTAEEALADDYFKSLTEIESEPSLQPLSRDAFAFESPDMTMKEIRKLMYSGILECHQQLQKDQLLGKEALLVHAGRNESNISSKRKYTSVRRSAVKSSAMSPKRTRLNQNAVAYGHSPLTGEAHNEKGVSDAVLGNVMSTSKQALCEATASLQGVRHPCKSSRRIVRSTSMEEVNQVRTARKEGFRESSLKQLLDTNLPTRHNALKEVGSPLHISPAMKSDAHAVTRPHRAKKTPAYLKDYMA